MRSMGLLRILSIIPFCWVLSPASFSAEQAAPQLAAPAPDKRPTRCSLPQPPLPAECKKERVEASGKIGWFHPQQFGKTAWAAQAKSKFGEPFAGIGKAACLREECVHAGKVGVGMKCTYSAFPCSPKVTPEQLAALDRSLTDPLSEAETKEFTALLAKAIAQKIVKDLGCKNCNADQRREKALKAWRKQQNLPEDGNPNIADLDTLRRKLGTS
jgi:hypothetical protein